MGGRNERRRYQRTCGREKGIHRLIFGCKPDSIFCCPSYCIMILPFLAFFSCLFFFGCLAFLVFWFFFKQNGAWENLRSGWAEILAFGQGSEEPSSTFFFRLLAFHFAFFPFFLHLLQQGVMPLPPPRQAADGSPRCGSWDGRFTTWDF